MSGRYAPATIRIAYTLLNMVMNEAIEEGITVQTPCRQIKLPRQDKVESAS